MITLVSTASLVGIALWLQVVARIRAELGFLTACSSVILVLYLSALAGWLAPATLLLYATGLGLGGIAVARLYTSPPESRAAVLLSVIIFAFLSAAAWLWLHGLAYHSWDEFSHWGRVGKTLSVTGRLPDERTGVMFKDYPPAAGLFHYYLVFSRFSEGGTYFAQALLLMSSVFALLRWTGRAGAPLYVLALALGLLLVKVLGLEYTTVEVDHLLGALFGGVLGAHAVGDRSDRRSTLALAPVLFCLPLIKPIGIVMALCAAGVIALDLGAAAIVRRGAGRLASPSHSSLAWVAVCLVLIAAPLVAHQSWKMHTTAHRFRVTFNVSVTGEGLRTLLMPSQRTPTQELIVHNFRSALRQSSLGPEGRGMTDGAGRWLGVPSRLPPRSAPEWFGCLTGLSIFTFFLLPREARTTHAVVHGAVAVGCVVYLGLLLYVYFYGFGTYEGTRVTSFGRYASTWFLAWALAVTAALGQASRGGRIGYAAGVSLLIASIAWGAVQGAPRDEPAVRTIAAERQRLQAVLQVVQGTVPPASPTYIVWQNSTGFPFYLLAYELCPRVTNIWCWSVGQTYYAGDVWTCPLSIEELSRSLDSFEYLLVANADDRFWDTYQSLFEEGASDANRSAVLFKIVRRGSAPQLRRVT